MLISVIVLVIALSTLLITPVISLVSGGFSSSRQTLEQEMAYYAADAGIEAVLSDLRQGKDPLSSSYVLPSVTVNGYTATISVTAPPREDMLPFGAVFADPESGTSLSPLAANTAFLYKLFNVRPRADFQVNWAYTPSSGSTQIRIFEGAGTGGLQVATGNASQSPLRFTLNARFIKGGTYTISFDNKSIVAITSAPFNTIGEPDNTWVRITAFKDLLITSSSGGLTLTVFARQGPGPNQVSSSVHISTWHGPN